MLSGMILLIDCKLDDGLNRFRLALSRMKVDRQPLACLRWRFSFRDRKVLACRLNEPGIFLAFWKVLKSTCAN